MPPIQGTFRGAFLDKETGVRDWKNMFGSGRNNTIRANTVEVEMPDGQTASAFRVYTHDAFKSGNANLSKIWSWITGVGDRVRQSWQRKHNGAQAVVGSLDNGYGKPIATFLLAKAGIYKGENPVDLASVTGKDVARLEKEIKKLRKNNTLGPAFKAIEDFRSLKHDLSTKKLRSVSRSEEEQTEKLRAGIQDFIDNHLGGTDGEDIPNYLTEDILDEVQERAYGLDNMTREELEDYRDNILSKVENRAQLFINQRMRDQTRANVHQVYTDKVKENDEWKADYNERWNAYEAEAKEFLTNRGKAEKKPLFPMSQAKPMNDTAIGKKNKELTKERGELVNAIAETKQQAAWENELDADSLYDPTDINAAYNATFAMLRLVGVDKRDPDAKDLMQMADGDDAIDAKWPATNEEATSHLRGFLDWSAQEQYKAGTADIDDNFRPIRDTDRRRVNALRNPTRQDFRKAGMPDHVVDRLVDISVKRHGWSGVKEDQPAIIEEEQDGSLQPVQDDYVDGDGIEDRAHPSHVRWALNNLMEDAIEGSVSTQEQINWKQSQTARNHQAFATQGGDSPNTVDVDDEQEHANFMKMLNEEIADRVVADTYTYNFDQDVMDLVEQKNAEMAKEIKDYHDASQKDHSIASLAWSKSQ